MHRVRSRISDTRFILSDRDKRRCAKEDGRTKGERKEDRNDSAREQTLPLDFSKGERRFVRSYAPAIAFDKRRDEPIQRTRVRLPSVDLISDLFSFPSCSVALKKEGRKWKTRVRAKSSEYRRLGTKSKGVRASEYQNASTRAPHRRMCVA